MFILSKILPCFILPPGIFIVLLFIILFLFKKKRQVPAGRLTVTVILLLYFFSIEPPGDLLIKYLENLYPPIDMEKNREAEFIVILGGGVVDNSPESGGKGSLGSESLQRLLHGYYLSKRYKIPVITSGRVLKGDDAEAESDVAMRELVRLGISRKRIYRDSISRNTFEQAVNIKKKFSAGSVILVTSAYHMPRSVYSFRSHSVKVIPAPTGYIGNRYGYDFFSFLPRADNLLKFYKACKEMIGFLYYAVRY